MNKKKVKKVNPTKNPDKPQIDIKKELEGGKKIQPDKVFEGYKKQDKKKGKKKK
tara:strand:- start:4967 stop:5128 length:162 start_codon:yes stop_codon:yes gene_type:complete